jgi:hypothetical protein
MRKRGMQNEATPQHSSIKKRAVLKPSVPIQFLALSPSIHVESSTAVNKCDAMLRSTKLLTRKIIAPVQKRVISALDIPSSSVMSGWVTGLLLLKKDFIRAKKPTEVDGVEETFLVFVFFVVFFSFFVFAIRLMVEV